MTNSQQHKKPTTAQMAYLRKLGDSTGRSFAWPKTAAEASEQINDLKKFKRDSSSDRRREKREARGEVARARGGSASVRDDELTGYGSTASWAGRA
jgi:hypothetical protein